MALYMSYPAAKALPLEGVLARADSFFTSSGGEVERGGGGGALFAGGFWTDVEDMSVLGRLGKGDVGKEGGSCDGGGDVGIVLCALSHGRGVEDALRGLGSRVQYLIKVKPYLHVPSVPRYLVS